MKAVVLAGGRGSRLMPLTDDMPKPLLPVAGYPILDYIAAQLKYYRVEEQILTLGYKAARIVAHAASYSGIKTVCRTEREPLGTCGSVKSVEDLLSETFLVLSGDCISDINLARLVRAHAEGGAEITVAVGTADDPSMYGVAEIGSDGKITAFYEKPGSDKYGNMVNLGVYAVSKSVLSEVPEGRAYDFSSDLFPRLIGRRKLGAYRHDGYWSDLGSIKSYYEANRLFLGGYEYPFGEVGGGTMHKQGTNVVSRSAKLYGSAGGCVICGGSVIGRGATLTDCVVLDGEVKGAHFRRIIKNGVFVDV